MGGIGDRSEEDKNRFNEDYEDIFEQNNSMARTTIGYNSIEFILKKTII
jgi:hypothetical protein